MVKQQQRRPDRCFLPVGGNSVTWVRVSSQRRPQQQVSGSAPGSSSSRTPEEEEEEKGAGPQLKRSRRSLSDKANRETAPESCDQTGSERCSAEAGAQREALESREDNRATEVPGAGLKVTIQRSSESREFGDKHPTTERLHCCVCDCTCPNAQSFQQHMSGADHQRRLQQITDSISLSPIPHTPGWRWCVVCQTHFTGDVILHRQTLEHKVCKKQSRPFCFVCKRHFRTPRKFVEHMKSPEHKLQVHLEKAEDEEMITVDAVGCFESERDSEERKRDEEEETQRGEEEEEGTRELEKKQVRDREDEEGGRDKTRGEELQRGQREGEQEAVVTVDVAEEEEAGGEQEETETLETSGGFNPNTSYGSSFVVPVSGFLCRLCQKFFFRENSARVEHCRTRSHFLRLQSHRRKGGSDQDQSQDSSHLS